MADKLNDRWDVAKRDFTKMTGKSKPKPKGLIDKAFNHTGVSTALKKCDQLIAAIEGEVKDMKKKGKLIAAGDSYISTVKKSCTSYMKLLDVAVRDEISDKGVKTTYSKALKFLRARLDSLEKQFESTIGNHQIASDHSTTGMEKAVKMVRRSLTATVANAAAGMKKIKANPTPEQFDEIFNTSDNIARKVQVQLISAATGQKKGMLPPSSSRRVDPRYVADLLTPWQAGGKGEAVADPDWTSQEVLAKLADFTRLLKLSNAFLDDLENALDAV